MPDFISLNREYFEKIAPIYDTYQDVSFEFETNWHVEIEKFLPELGIPNNKLIDIGCGTGAAGLFFGNLGYDVMGLDRSSNMLVVSRNKLRLFNLTVEERRLFFKAHPHIISDPNAKTDITKLKPKIRYIQGDILEAASIVETFGAATMFDTLSYIQPSDLEKLFRNINSVLLFGGIFCILFPTDLLFKSNIGSANIEKANIDYFIETKWDEEISRTVRRTLNFKASKALTSALDAECVEYNHSLRDIVSLFENNGFQIQKMICDTHVAAADDKNVNDICNTIEKSYEMANGVRKILFMGKKIA